MNVWNSTPRSQYLNPKSLKFKVRIKTFRFHSDAIDEYFDLLDTRFITFRIQKLKRFDHFIFALMAAWTFRFSLQFIAIWSCFYSPSDKGIMWRYEGAFGTFAYFWKTRVLLRLTDSELRIHRTFWSLQFDSKLSDFEFSNFQVLSKSESTLSEFAAISLSTRSISSTWTCWRLAGVWAQGDRSRRSKLK